MLKLVLFVALVAVALQRGGARLRRTREPDPAAPGAWWGSCVRLAVLLVFSFFLGRGGRPTCWGSEVLA